MLPDTNSDFTLDLIYDTALDYRGTPLVDDAPMPVDPIKVFIEHVQDQESLRKNSRAVLDADWDQQIGTLEKLPETGTMAKRLGIVRTEFKTIDGERWVHAFNKAGDLVDARVVYEE